MWTNIQGAINPAGKISCEAKNYSVEYPISVQPVIFPASILLLWYSFILYIYLTTIFHRRSLDPFLSEYQPHIKGSDGNKLNPIFEKKIQGQKLPGRWAIAESKLPRFRAQLCISNWVDMDRHILPNDSPVSTSFFSFIFISFIF